MHTFIPKHTFEACLKTNYVKRAAALAWKPHNREEWYLRSRFSTEAAAQSEQASLARGKSRIACRGHAKNDEKRRDNT